MEDIFLKNLPSLDLHGFDRETARVATEDFIDENIILKNDKILIISLLVRVWSSSSSPMIFLSVVAVNDSIALTG